MTITIENELQEDFLPDYCKTADKVIQAVLQMEGFPYETEVNVLLTTDAKIQKENKLFRDIDRPTDVLSFPMIPFSYPCEYDIIESMGINCINPDSGEIVLGDIMISIPRMLEQAASYGHSPVREFAFLLTHSMLHLLGYDHMVPEEAAVMEKRQRVILTQLEIER